MEMSKEGERGPSYRHSEELQKLSGQQTGFNFPFSVSECLLSTAQERRASSW